MIIISVRYFRRGGFRARGGLLGYIYKGFPSRALKPSDGHVDFLIGEKRWSRVMVFRRANCMGRKDNSRPEYDRMERKNLGYGPQGRKS